MKRVFVEKKPGFRIEADGILADLRETLHLPGLKGLRLLRRYDIDGISDADYAKALNTVFVEPPVDDAHEGEFPVPEGSVVFAAEYLPGQYDQRADSAAQCVQMLTHGARPLVATANVFVVTGDLTAAELAKVKGYLINPVDSREASLAVPATLAPKIPAPDAVPVLTGFNTLPAGDLAAKRKELGLAMSDADIAFCQKYFRETEHREPTLTEIRMLDTYWSDHCRHTTFLTELESVEIEPSPLTAPFAESLARYLATRKALGRESKDVCMMDMACLGARALKKSGDLDDLEESEEINAASIVVPVEIDGKTEEWLVMFKNETHNHPTEIEPFGGAATCLGGAIRDPLSGRSYVYQAMRVTGSADPRTPFEQTLPGKLPQRVITRGAARGYSAYGNQIGLATGLVAENYHPDFVAKRMEIGAVVAAGPRSNVRREEPAPGDIIVLVGGRTGRDGVGGATGSSKEHTETALQNSAEVQKGDAPMERKLQRLFRNPTVSRLIKRCNDFGAGGVSVAIGELAPSLEIDLDAVLLKYEGLNGTEIAISESQERMAVVLEAKDVAAFRAAADLENLESAIVAQVTNTGRLRMKWRGDTIVDLSRDFLDTNGVKQTSRAFVAAPDASKSPFIAPAAPADLASEWVAKLASLPLAGQRGLVERFDASIGANTVLHPFGGRTQSTPAEAMAAKLPVLEGKHDACTIMSYGYNADIAKWSPGHGAVCAVVESVTRVVAAGGNPDRMRLTLQEYFEKLGNDPKRWGKPVAALLGAFGAQLDLAAPAIGGKDSMSGSFKNIDVPPTLVSFAIVPASASKVISPEFKLPGSKVVLVRAPRTAAELPDLVAMRRNHRAVFALIQKGVVLAARSVRAGGLGSALAEMTFGNRIGIRLLNTPGADFFMPEYGSLILEVPADADLGALPHTVLGETLPTPEILMPSGRVEVEKLFAAWDHTLESTFPSKAAEPAGTPDTFSHKVSLGAKPRVRLAKPRVIIPVFPGSNCEYDSARAFRAAGAEADIFVIRNKDARDIDASLRELADRIKSSQILMFPGGFSAGDEPDGSGKFIAGVFRNPIVRDATMDLLKNRDGLILGVCNGFQAIIKLGLVPFGEIRDMDEASPTLFYNNIGRHVSRYVHTRVASVQSPWLSKMAVGEVHTIPVSHGEGNFVATPEVVAQLAKSGQLAFQYCDASGRPSYDIGYNPNGSVHAIEGITSPCGRVLGKMGHSERRGADIARNIPGNKFQPLFEGGVEYFS
jgi:phosphoribosylformylglycinamidine synthase